MLNYQRVMIFFGCAFSSVTTPWRHPPRWWLWFPLSGRGSPHGVKLSQSAIVMRAANLSRFGDLGGFRSSEFIWFIQYSPYLNQWLVLLYWWYPNRETCQVTELLLEVGTIHHGNLRPSGTRTNGNENHLLTWFCHPFSDFLKSSFGWSIKI